jgi:hypothetical protein
VVASVIICDPRMPHWIEIFKYHILAFSWDGKSFILFNDTRRCDKYFSEVVFVLHRERCVLQWIWTVIYLEAWSALY